ncbi:MAG: photosynthetic complex putative assembly protein PuhB [Aquabacterium sp.]|nr:photosynthetic complex putative assembly protein PuhB [Aquabacterium sp.]
MTIQNHGHEHEFEPQYGLPERLPADERILWQGSPDAAALARHVFHLRKLALYFAVLMAAALLPTLWAGEGLGKALLSVRWVLPLSLLGLGSVALLAWLTARTTVYTLTDRRVVMRLGIALTVTFNLPLTALSGAALRAHGQGAADISLRLAGSDRIAYLHLWPSVRPWRFTQPEPTLRCVPDAQKVSALLQQAWSRCTGLATTPAEALAHRPADAAVAASSGNGVLQPSAV